MTTILARPTATAPLQLHLYHFLKLVMQAAPKANEHQQLLVETLKYLQSITRKQLYKIKIQKALDTVSNTVLKKQTNKTVLTTIQEFTNCYQDLMDKIVKETNTDWVIPPADSEPTNELRRMNIAWETARDQLRLSSIWDLNPQ